MMITRYSLDYENCNLEYDPDGDVVDYGDHCAVVFVLQSRLEELNQKVDELEKDAVRNYLEAMPVAFIHFPPKKADLARVDFCPKAKTKEIGSGWITVPLYKGLAMQASEQ